MTAPLVLRLVALGHSNFQIEGATVIEAIGVLLTAAGLYLAYYRLGRLDFYGHSIDKSSPPTERNVLRFALRVRNGGVLTVHLKNMTLRNRSDILSGKIWSLAVLKVDGIPYDLRNAPLVFTSGETKLLVCEFWTIDKTPLGNVGIVFLDLETTERVFLRERRRRPLVIQISVGARFEIVFPGSERFIEHLHEKHRQRARGSTPPP
jgi:hypothetical protein